MRRRTLLGILLTEAFVTSCGLPKVEDRPFVVSADSVFSKIRTIVVSPVTTPGEFLIPESAAAKLETALEDGLRTAGFSVVPSFEYIGIWQHIADVTGGFYDIHSGALDEDLFNAATRRLRSELSERYQVDALLYAELWPGSVPFYDGVATWDGVSQAVFGARRLNGYVNALSLVVVLEDTAGTELFSNGVGFATMDAWHNNSWLPLDLEALIGDPRLVSNAVTSVLEPIVEAKAAQSSQAR